MQKVLLSTCMPLDLSAFPSVARDLVPAVGGEPSGGFDPIEGRGNGDHPLFQSPLPRLDADLRMVGDPATGWVLKEDGVTWTITPRDDARFSDASPVTAVDVAFSYNIACDGGGLADLKVMAKARATGPQTVTLTLAQPSVTFIRQLTTLGMVQQARYCADYARNPLGSGPFRLDEGREGEALIG